MKILISGSVSLALLSHLFAITLSKPLENMKYSSRWGLWSNLCYDCFKSFRDGISLAFAQKKLIMLSCNYSLFPTISYKFIQFFVSSNALHPRANKEGKRGEISSSEKSCFNFPMAPSHASLESISFVLQCQTLEVSPNIVVVFISGFNVRQVKFLSFDLTINSCLREIYIHIYI